MKTTSLALKGLPSLQVTPGTDRVDQGGRVGERVPGREERRVGAVDTAGDLQRLVDQPGPLELCGGERVEVLDQRRVSGITLDGENAPGGAGSGVAPGASTGGERCSGECGGRRQGEGRPPWRTMSSAAGGSSGTLFRAVAGWVGVRGRAGCRATPGCGSATSKSRGAVARASISGSDSSWRPSALVQPLPELGVRPVDVVGVAGLDVRVLRSTRARWLVRRARRAPSTRARRCRSSRGSPSMSSALTVPFQSRTSTVPSSWRVAQACTSTSAPSPSSVQRQHLVALVRREVHRPVPRLAQVAHRQQPEAVVEQGAAGGRAPRSGR